MDLPEPDPVVDQPLDDVQAAEAAALMSEYEARGECWMSGFPIPACRATVCDCYDYCHVAPCSPEELDRLIPGFVE